MNSVSALLDSGVIWRLPKRRHKKGWSPTISTTVTVRSRLRHARKALLIFGAAMALAAGTFVTGAASPASAATSLPCDIYAAAGTPCVAAHSTTRALYAAYNGPLYQVKRASDGTTTNIGTLAAGLRQRGGTGLVLRRHHLHHHRDL